MLVAGASAGTLAAMRISVAMAVHDAERYLPELLASLARQTALPHELVVYDDASRDSTPRLLEAFRADAPFPVHIERHAEHRGHVAGFLRAAELCRGDAIAYCDGDDVWRDHKLELCGRALERTGAALVLHSTLVVDAELRDLGRTWPAIDATRTVPPLGLTGLDIDAPGMAMVFRRDVLEADTGARRPSSRYGPEKEMLHDEWTLFLAGALGPVHLLAEPLVLYRQHEANDSGGWLRRQRRQTLEPATDDYRKAADHTSSCARFLKHAAHDLPALADRLEAAAGHYERTSESWELRLSLYGTERRRERFRLLRRLLAAHAYRRRAAGGFGRAALVKDLAGGLILRVGLR
jgi:glycosyltransferase involved in cell wall biosynthesis